MGHIGFSPTRQTLLAPIARSAVGCSASRMKGELHPSKNRSYLGLRHLVHTFLLMDDSANDLICFLVWPLQRQQWVRSPNKPDYDRLRPVHQSMLFRCLGWRKRKRDDHTLSYADALANTASESIEAIVRKTEDIVCGIRSTYGGGASATEGDVWGACWGKGLRRGAREGLVGASEGGYVGLWNEIHASECDNTNLYARRRASGLV